MALRMAQNAFLKNASIRIFRDRRRVHGCGVGFWCGGEYILRADQAVLAALQHLRLPLGTLGRTLGITPSPLLLASRGQVCRVAGYRAVGWRQTNNF